MLLALPLIEPKPKYSKNLYRARTLALWAKCNRWTNCRRRRRRWSSCKFFCVFALDFSTLTVESEWKQQQRTMLTTTKSQPNGFYILFNSEWLQPGRENQVFFPQKSNCIDWNVLQLLNGFLVGATAKWILYTVSWFLSLSSNCSYRIHRSTSNSMWLGRSNNGKVEAVQTHAVKWCWPFANHPND